MSKARQLSNLYNTELPIDQIPLEPILLDHVYPVGSFYVEYPDAESNDDAVEFPVAQRPANIFGGTWSEQWSTESVFFRTRGTDSDSGRSNGHQGHAFQSHGHRLQSGRNDNGQYHAAGSATGHVGAGFSQNFDAGSGWIREPVTEGGNGVPQLDVETRPSNRRIKIWKRTA